MKSIFTVILALIISANGFSQDVKAKAILDKLSAKTKSYTTIKAEFQLLITNKVEGINESQSGKIQIKGDNYLLSIKGQDVVVNDKYMFTIIKESKEIQLTDLPEEEEDFINPTKIFTLYESGFKYKFVKEENGIQIINLYPIDVEEKSFHRVVLHIDKSKTQVVKVEQYGKGGANLTYKVKSFITNQSILDNKFVFDKAKYSGFEIIDLRE